MRITDFDGLGGFDAYLTTYTVQHPKYMQKYLESLDSFGFVKTSPIIRKGMSLDGQKIDIWGCRILISCLLLNSIHPFQVPKLPFQQQSNSKRTVSPRTNSTTYIKNFDNITQEEIDADLDKIISNTENVTEKKVWELVKTMFKLD